MKTSKLRIIGTFLLFVIALSFASVTSADGVRKRIKFAKGKHSATISGNVIRGDVDTYIVGARAMQTMSVKVTALENNAAFQIQAPDGSYLSGAGETDDATSWSDKLPDDGDYQIVVGGTRGNCSYKLTVTIR